MDRTVCQHVYFGDAVAISGGTVVVGAFVNGKVWHLDGRAYVFTKTVAGWKRAAVLKGSTWDFGGSVAISGTTAIVGGWEGSGRVYLFEA